MVDGDRNCVITQLTNNERAAFDDRVHSHRDVHFGRSGCSVSTPVIGRSVSVGCFEALVGARLDGPGQEESIIDT